MAEQRCLHDILTLTTSPEPISALIVDYFPPPPRPHLPAPRSRRRRSNVFGRSCPRSRPIVTVAWKNRLKLRRNCPRLRPLTKISRGNTMNARSNGNFMRCRLKLNLVPGPHTLLLTLICQRQSLSREQTYSGRVSGRAVHGYGRIEGSEHRSRARTVLACDMCVKKKN